MTMTHVSYRRLQFTKLTHHLCHSTFLIIYNIFILCHSATIYPIFDMISLKLTLMFDGTVIFRHKFIVRSPILIIVYYVVFFMDEIAINIPNNYNIQCVQFLDEVSIIFIDVSIFG